jgi:hypothetical protein
LTFEPGVGDEVQGVRPQVHRGFQRGAGRQAEHGHFERDPLDLDSTVTFTQGRGDARGGTNGTAPTIVTTSP